MIDKEKLIKNWDGLKNETKAKILKLADKEIKEDYFVPKEGELSYSWSYGISLETGNVFRTPEEAIFAGKCDYFTKRFETYVNRHSDKLDWNDITQEKHRIYYSRRDMIKEYKIDWSIKTQGAVYASSIEILKDAIADIGEDNFLKYVMKVEEK